MAAEYIEHHAIEVDEQLDTQEGLVAPVHPYGLRVLERLVKDIHLPDGITQAQAEGFFTGIVAPMYRFAREAAGIYNSRPETIEPNIQKVFMRMQGMSDAEVSASQNPPETRNQASTGRSNFINCIHNAGYTPEIIRKELDNYLAGAGQDADPEESKSRIQELVPLSAVVDAGKIAVEAAVPNHPLASTILKPKDRSAVTGGPQIDTVAIQLNEPLKDNLGIYLDQINQIPLLNAEQEVDLAKRIEAGLYAAHLLKSGEVAGGGFGAKSPSKEELEYLVEDGQAARDMFIQSNLRLVFSLAKKYSRSALPMQDLVQEGNAGLIRAVEKFDYAKGFKFSTYATWWIRQAITRGIADQSRTVRLPVHVQEEINKILNVKRRFVGDFGREPEQDELAAAAEISLERLTDLEKWNKDPMSLDAPVGDDDTTFGDMVARDRAPEPEVSVVDTQKREILNSLLDQLDPTSALVLRAEYGLLDSKQLSLEEIGAKMGVSADRVRRLERKALRDMRKLADQDLAELLG